MSNPNPQLTGLFFGMLYTLMFVIAAVVLQDIGDATSESLLNLDPSETTPEVICDR